MDFQTMSREDYDALPGFGYSQAKLLSRSPELYYRRYVMGTLVQQQTEAHKFGHAVEGYLLLGEDPIDALDYVIAPDDLLSSDGHLRSKAAREWKATQTKEVIPAWKYEELVSELMGKFHAIEEQIDAHPEARDLISDCVPSVGLTWRHGIGPQMKGYADMICPHAVVDMKTTRAIEYLSWQREIEKYCYHWQAATYSEGALAHGMPNTTLFKQIVIENIEPYRVMVYEIDDAYIEIGTVEMAKQKFRYLELDRNIARMWRDEGHGKSVSIGPSHWLMQKSELDEFQVEWEEDE